MSKVLVASASWMGGTREIAEALAGELRQTDHSVTISACATAADAENFEAVVIGSALYSGHWMPEASGYSHHQATHLTSRPIFLFQSGPCEADRHSVAATAIPRAVAKIVRRVGMPGPITVAGRLGPTTDSAWAYDIGVELHEYLDQPSLRPNDDCQPVGFHSP